MKPKENAVVDYMAMCTKSWTYDRMTEAERERCRNVYSDCVEQGMIKGTYETRWNVCQMIYFGFLAGIGYNGGEWRAPGYRPEEARA